VTSAAIGTVALFLTAVSAVPVASESDASSDATDAIDRWRLARSGLGEKCERVLATLGVELNPFCRNIRVRVRRGASATAASSRCGLSVSVGDATHTKDHGSASGWEPSEKRPSDKTFARWSFHSKQAYGQKAEIGVRPNMDAVVRDAVIAAGKRVADKCLLTGDDGYEEYRLVRDGPEGLAGTCLDKVPTVDGSVFVLHRKPGVVTSDLWIVPFSAWSVGEDWLATARVDIKGEHDCPAGSTECSRSWRGVRRIAWRFQRVDDGLRGTLTVTDNPIDLVRIVQRERFEIGPRACQVHTRFHATRVPQ